MNRRRYLWSAAPLLLSACSNDAGTIIGCEDGQVLNAQGTCIDEARTETRDTGRDTSGDVAESPDVTPDDALPVDEPCSPNERTCRDRATAAICNAEGSAVRLETCAASTICVEGQCVPDTGCAPGRRLCDGASIVECLEDGSQRFVQDCEFGCNRGACADPCAGDGKNYLGCAFYAVDLDNYSGDGFSPGADVAQFAVTVSNGTSSDVELTVTGGALSDTMTRTVRSGALETLELPMANIDGSGLFDLAYRIESSAPVTMHQFNPLNNVGVYSNDASLLLPATSLGSEYVVANWASEAAGAQTFVTVIAVAEGPTSVTVTSPVATAAGVGIAALTPNSPIVVNLTQGQVASFATVAGTDSDLTGFRVSASQPVAVFSGSECGNVPLGVPFCDHLEEQLLPVPTWGREFVGAKFQPRGDETDVWKVVAAEDGTTLNTVPNIPGVNGRTIGVGEVVEFESAADFLLFADKPIALAQFMVGSAYPGPSGGCDLSAFPEVTRGCAIPRTCDSGSAIGDPAFLISVPSAQFRSDYIVLTPAQYAQNFLTIIGPEGFTVRIDDREITQARADIGPWDILRLPSAAGVHRIVASAPVGLAAYGYDCDVSYAYPGGLNLDAL